jgi:hypothetical protein
MHFTNGAIYEGRFRDDAVDGQGTLRLSRSLVVPRSEQDSDDDDNGSDDNGDDGDDDNENEPDGGGDGDGADGKPDFMIPISFQSDIGNIHRKAGFTQGGE